MERKAWNRQEGNEDGSKKLGGHVFTRTWKQGREKRKWDETLNPLTMFLVMHFLQQGFILGLVSFPNSITSWDQEFKFMSLWWTFLFQTTTEAEMHMCVLPITPEFS